MLNYAGKIVGENIKKWNNGENEFRAKGYANSKPNLAA